MENVVLVIHLILALCLIGVVLLQRSEGGGLGIGGGSNGGAVSSRGLGTALGKLTWAFAAAFIVTSIGLTIIARQNSAGSSVVDRLGVEQSSQTPAVPSGNDLLPPPTNDEPTAPRAD